MESKKYKLNKEDTSKIIKGLGVALGGALLTYLAEIIPNVDFGQLTPLVVAISCVIINAGRKFLAGENS